MRREDTWVATFADVTKYIRERKNAVVNSKMDDQNIAISVNSSLDREVYNVPLTLKTYLPNGWKTAILYNLNETIKLTIENDDQGNFVLYEILPGTEGILSRN